MVQISRFQPQVLYIKHGVIPIKLDMGITKNWNMKNIFKKKVVDELNGTKFHDNNWIIS